MRQNPDITFGNLLSHDISELSSCLILWLRDICQAVILGWLVVCHFFIWAFQNKWLGASWPAHDISNFMCESAKSYTCGKLGEFFIKNFQLFCGCVSFLSIIIAGICPMVAFFLGLVSSWSTGGILSWVAILQLVSCVTFFIFWLLNWPVGLFFLLCWYWVVWGLNDFFYYFVQNGHVLDFFLRFPKKVHHVAKMGLF